MTELTPDQFQAQGASSVFGGSHARNALNFARVALTYGNAERARSFAEVGLAVCPPLALGLKATLQKILKNKDAR